MNCRTAKDWRSTGAGRQRTWCRCHHPLGFLLDDSSVLALEVLWNFKSLERDRSGRHRSDAVGRAGLSASRMERGE